MSIVFGRINHRKPFLLPCLDLVSALEVFLPTIIHKTLGLAQVFPRSLKRCEEPFGSVKSLPRVPLRGPTSSLRILTLGIHITIAYLKTLVMSPGIAPRMLQLPRLLNLNYQSEVHTNLEVTVLYAQQVRFYSCHPQSLD